MRLNERIASIVFVIILSTSAHGQSSGLDPTFGGLVNALRCQTSAVILCSGDVCFEGSRVGSMERLSDMEFGFDFSRRLSEAPRSFYNTHRGRPSYNGLEGGPAAWPLEITEVSPALLNKPLFVRFSVQTDLTKVRGVALLLPKRGSEPGAYNIKFGLVEENPRMTSVSDIPKLSRRIVGGECMSVDAVFRRR